MTAVSLAFCRKCSTVLLWPALAAVSWGELAPSIKIASPWDKAAHVGAYFALAVLLTIALGAGRRLIAAVAGLVILGAVLEVLQHWTGRDPSVEDAAFNALGACAGWAAAGVFVRKMIERGLPEYYLAFPARDNGMLESASIVMRRDELPTSAIAEIERQLAAANAADGPRQEMYSKQEG